MKLTTPWPSRGYPFDAAEEAAFLTALRGAARRQRPVDEHPAVSARDHITLVVTALRCGTTVDDVAEIAPGVSLAALVRAYRQVHTSLRRTWTAYERITGAPDRVFGRTGDVLAGLLPLTVSRVRQAGDVTGAWEFEQLRIDALWDHYDRVWELVHTTGDLTLSDELYHPERDCLLLNPRFLPRIVAEIAPVRLARLLGETSYDLDDEPTPVGPPPASGEPGGTGQ